VKTDDIYLARFPFGDVPGMKLRPVLLLTDKVGSVPEIVVAYISSVIPAAPLPSDIIIDPTSPDVATTNLHVKSIVRLHRIATVHSTNIVRYLGHLPDSLLPEVDNKLRALLRI
jgi:mRNA interferase MazF